jgi:hypothetical protein
MVNEIKTKQRDKFNINVLYAVILWFMWLRVSWTLLLYILDILHKGE